MPEDRDYEVGYGRPPKATQFKKGQSGNPKGRPKGRVNLITAVQAELEERIVITENGQTRSITKGEAVAKQLVRKAVSGDVKAIPLVIGLHERAVLGVEEEDVSLEQDRELLRKALERYGQPIGGDATGQRVKET